MTDSKTDAPASSAGKSTKKGTGSKAGRARPVKVAQKPTLAVATGVEPAAIKAAKSASAPKEQAPKTHEDLRLKELIETLTEKTGLRRNHVKKLTSALLEELGRAVENSREINLRGLGRIKYQRIIEKPGAKITVARIKRKLDQNSDSE